MPSRWRNRSIQPLPIPRRPKRLGLHRIVRPIPRREPHHRRGEPHALLQGDALVHERLGRQHIADLAQENGIPQQRDALLHLQLVYPGAVPQHGHIQHRAALNGDGGLHLFRGAPRVVAQVVRQRHEGLRHQVRRENLLFFDAVEGLFPPADAGHHAHVPVPAIAEPGERAEVGAAVRFVGAIHKHRLGAKFVCGADRYFFHGVTLLRSPNFE